MYVCTYFEPLHPGREADLEHWASSWTRMGWKPVVLGPRNAERHPRAQELEAAIRKMPTINTTDYEYACYRRWWAIASSRYNFMVDIDVINLSLEPRELPEELTCLGAGWVPCAVCGKPDAFGKVLNWILFWDGKPELINGRAHMSDMYLFQRHRPPILGPLCDDFKVGPRLPLTHVAAASVVCGSFITPRPEIIRRLAADPSADIP